MMIHKHITMIHTKQYEEIVNDVGTLTRNIMHTKAIHLKISNRFIDQKYPLNNI